MLTAIMGAASSDDSFVVLPKGEYIQVLIEPEVDMMDVLTRLNLQYLISAELTDRTVEDLQPLAIVLAQKMDALMIEVSDILGMPIVDATSQIIICSDEERMRAHWASIGMIDFFESPAYFEGTKTIWASLDHLNAASLGRKIAFFIQGQYFQVPPPSNVRDILADYVEYSLRKMPSQRPLGQSEINGDLKL